MPFDCELIQEGLAAQPVNTLSSAAFLIAAAVVLSRHRWGSLALALAGVGSVMFHGFPSDFSSVVHDIGVWTLALLATLSMWRQRRAMPRLGVVMLSAGFAIWFVSRTGGIWCDPASIVQGHAAWHVLGATGVAVIFVAEEEHSTEDPLAR